jgi:hypothetical protein
MKNHYKIASTATANADETTRFQTESDSTKSHPQDLVGEQQQIQEVEMNTEAFVYKWTNIENGKFYIGKHKGHINDGYISSGKAFLAVYNQNPDIFKREILFVGTHEDVIHKENELIQQAIATVGYDNIYNLTTWQYLKQWKRTCLHCGQVVDPRNQEWLKAFEQEHFENCRQHPFFLELVEKSRNEKKYNKKSRLRIVDQTTNNTTHINIDHKNFDKYQYLLKAQEILTKSKNTLSKRITLASIKKQIDDLL